MGRQAYLVLSGSSQIPLQVSVDGQAQKPIVVDEDRKYDLVNTSYGPHRFSLKVPTKEEQRLNRCATLRLLRRFFEEELLVAS